MFPVADYCLQLYFGVLKNLLYSPAGGICATLNLCIQALKLYLYYHKLFEGCYFGAIMGTVKIAKIKCL